MADPRAALAHDPRVTIHDSRGPLSVCTCGLPNCPRLSPHGPQVALHPAAFSPEAHLAGPHGFPGLPIGAGPMGHVDPALLYTMGAAYGMKEGPEVMRSLPPLNGYYPYDPTAVYPYMNGYAGIDARRKNATKESTNTLKAWLFEHRKNPYPTKGEKIMLAILTKMTLTQVSTWFANARRRLKKENKMTWASKDDDLDDDVTSEVNVGGDVSGDEDGHPSRHRDVNGSVGDDDDDDILSITSAGDIDVEDNDDVTDEHHRLMLLHGITPPGGASHLLPHTSRLLPTSSNTTPMFLHGAQNSLTSISQQQCSTSSNRVRDSGVIPRNTSSSQGSAESQESSGRDSVSPSCERKCNKVLLHDITPPPSPSDVRRRRSQSGSPSHRSPSPRPHSHQSTATIHHHPAVSVPATPSASSNTSSSSSSPCKPKIWSIADVVSSKDNANTSASVTSASEGRHPLGGASPVISVRSGGMLSHPAQVPQDHGPYGVAYYPYAMAHPAAAAAIMASQAQHLSRLPPGYSRALPGHMASMIAAPRPHPEYLMRPAHHGSPHNIPHGRGKEDHHPGKPSTPVTSQRSELESRSTKCTPTAFTPVVQRQM